MKHSTMPEPPALPHARVAANMAKELSPVRGEGPRKGRPALKVDPDAIRALFDIPQPQAARTLGISLTALKKECRRIGVSRWPYQRHSRMTHPVRCSTTGTLLGSIVISLGDEGRPRAAPVFTDMSSVSTTASSCSSSGSLGSLTGEEEDDGCSSSSSSHGSLDKLEVELDLLLGLPEL
eukprot:Tamp_18191.p2 GENE.Tamp_18191~~Tamp_18191.p2  ORF type:complete len:179 (-),score=17.89 Tamp_18191:337-873(-)